MAIHDPLVTVTCDATGCHEERFVELQWKYRSMSERSGYWSDEHVENELEEDGWIVDGAMTYCSEGCHETATCELEASRDDAVYMR